MLKTVMAGALALMSATGAARAQDAYPERPVRFVVPFAAGSATDTLARLVGQHMSKAFGKQMLVENVVGANGTIAAGQVARAQADGYTVFVTSNSTHSGNQSLMKNVPYDHVKDFAPITRLGNIPLALVVHPSVPAKSVAELVAYAKANPDKLTFGSGSSSSRIAGEMVKTLAGISMINVAYKSNPQAIQDLLSGQISLVFADLSTTMPQVKAGAVNGLAVSTAQRTSLAPDLPTMAEAGVPGYDLVAWFAAFVPAKTPKPIVDKLHAAFLAAMNDTEVKTRLIGAGIEPVTSTPEELGAFVQSETRKWADIVKAAGIEPE